MSGETSRILVMRTGPSTRSIPQGPVQAGPGYREG
jgi:hypothetical protein